MKSQIGKACAELIRYFSGCTLVLEGCERWEPNPNAFFYFSSGHSLRRDKIEMPAVNKGGSTSLVIGGKNALTL